MTERMRALGREIAGARVKKGMSQESLSAFAGMSRSHLAMIECGRVKPTVETLWRITDALEIELSSLIKKCEKPEE